MEINFLKEATFAKFQQNEKLKKLLENTIGKYLVYECENSFL